MMLLVVISIRPFFLQCFDKAFRFAVCIWRVWPGANMALAQRMCCITKRVADIAHAIVRHNTAHGDTFLREPLRCT